MEVPCCRRPYREMHHCIPDVHNALPVGDCMRRNYTTKIRARILVYELKQYKLLGADGAIYLSDTKGLFGGHRGGRGYGRMDCRAALRAIANGGYVRHRVFFADEAAAIA